jgi:aspartyl protease family protein
MRLDTALFLLIPIGAIAVVVPRLAERWTEPPALSANAATPATPALSGTLRLRDRGDGHFEVEGRIGARRVPFLVDTGATLVALTWETGRDLGLVAPGDAMDVRISTANGAIQAKRVVIERLRLDGIELPSVEAMVLPRGALSVNLLGMSFLSRLRHFEISRGTLLLEN